MLDEQPLDERPLNDVQPRTQISEEEFDAAVSPPDLKGRVNLRLDQMLQQEIENIAEDSDYPLKSVSEVVRFCLLHGMERLRDWRPKPTLLGAIKAATNLTIRDKMQSDAMDMLQRMDERVNWYIANGHYDEAIDMVGQIRSYFDGVQPNFWSQYIINEIEKRFEDWISRIDAARR